MLSSLCEGGPRELVNRLPPAHTEDSLLTSSHEPPSAQRPRASLEAATSCLARRVQVKSR